MSSRSIETHQGHTVPPPLRQGSAPLELRGRDVLLKPLDRSHRDDLLRAAADGELWTLGVTNVPGPHSVDDYIARALEMGASGTAYPFVIDRHGTIVGSTRFWKYDQSNRKVEIGHTWISRSWQRTGVNSEAKYLMLAYAFEVLGCVRVQFTTDVLNKRSRAAILRLGATEEGIIRNERIMPDGRKRNSVRFSIIDEEWPALKLRYDR